MSEERPDDEPPERQDEPPEWEDEPPEWEDEPPEWEDEPPERQEVVHARGHENVSAEHGSTFEVTSDDWLTPAGDCILAVDADRVPAEFDRAFVEACRSRAATITVEFAVDVGERVLTERITGRGHPDLEYTGDRSFVGRTSDYVDDRTAVVDADAAAADVDRELVSALSMGAPVTVTFTVRR